MTLDPIVALPAVISAAIIYTDSAEGAFFRVYLPILLLLPDGYFFGWPPMNFHQYAILPIGLTIFWWALNGRWRWSWIDVLVLGFLSWTLISDFHQNYTDDLVNRIASPMTLALFPYLAGKFLIEQSGRRIAVARRFVFFVFIDVIISVYEFRFAVNPYRKTFGPFFSTVDTWFTQIRYGLGRTSGPFNHAIFMGAIVAIAIMLYRYVAHFQLWEPKFRWLPKLPLSKSHIIFLSLIAGSLMTLSRGPWIAAIVGVMVAAIGLARNRRRAFRRTVLLLALGAAVVYVGGKSYVSAPVRTGGSAEELESAEYRAKLWEEYKPIALEKSFWGWGSPDWPKVPGMSSIDNWYILLILEYGVTGLILFALMLGVPVVLLLREGLLESDRSDDQRALLFTMGGIIVAVAVYLGGQLFPMLFLFLGWSDACLMQPARRLAPAPAFVFRRVIA
jgi:O-antigen ligase